MTPRCPACGRQAPYGDERYVWLWIHYGVAHRVWWFIRRAAGFHA